MKQLKISFILPLFLFGFVSSEVSAQIDFGVRGGFHSYDLDVGELDSMGVMAGIRKASFGLHVGLFSRIGIGGLYIEPAMVLNNISAKYTVVESNEEVEEGSLVLDVPVVLGLNIGIVDLFGGPVAHLRFSDYKDLVSAGAYEDNFSNAHFGLQLGGGVNLGKWGVELRYEQNFKDNDLGIVDSVRDIKFVDANSRILASINYKL